MSVNNIFDASREGDINFLKEYLKTNPNLEEKNEYGFTALHCAAMGSNATEIDKILEVLKLLIEAGSPLEVEGTRGRTALYLAAEFSPSIAVVQLLLDAGANADVHNEQGIHIIENAMIPETQKLLSEVTGKPIPEEPEPEPEPIKMKASAWNKAKSDIDKAFDILENSGLIVLQDAGTTQEDGFSDCSEIFHKRNSNINSILGFCFYSRQDLKRAKKTSVLPLSIWGAPEGSQEDTEKVGKLVLETLENAGFTVEWNGSSSIRPLLYLHKYTE